MGGLGHYLESGNIATTQISLIREHTEIIKPPRALWVSFPLGRPFGNPNDADFQRDVLKAALELVEFKEGPVLEDYPKDAREIEGPQAQIACPVDFAPPPAEKGSLEALCQNFRREFSQMQSWHRLALEKVNRSTSGISTMNADEIGELFCSFIGGNTDEAESDGKRLSDSLRLGAEDLKAIYLEALSAQPGQTADGLALTDWFWGQTYAAQVLNEVRRRCLTFSDKDMLLAGKLLLVPRNQMHHFER
ncbi:MAG TPA: hypothetical protein VJ969_00950 [Desulfopila sp.]|nr:hypothetical protein [Desulfopila sp.]